MKRGQTCPGLASYYRSFSLPRRRIFERFARRTAVLSDLSLSRRSVRRRLSLSQAYRNPVQNRNWPPPWRSSSSPQCCHTWGRKPHPLRKRCAPAPRRADRNLRTQIRKSASSRSTDNLFSVLGTLLPLHPVITRAEENTTHGLTQEPSPVFLDADRLANVTVSGLRLTVSQAPLTRETGPTNRSDHHCRRAPDRSRDRTGGRYPSSPGSRFGQLPTNPVLKQQPGALVACCEPSGRDVRNSATPAATQRRQTARLARQLHRDSRAPC